MTQALEKSTTWREILGQPDIRFRRAEPSVLIGDIIADPVRGPRRQSFCLAGQTGGSDARLCPVTR